MQLPDEKTSMHDNEVCQNGVTNQCCPSRSRSNFLNCGGRRPKWPALLFCPHLLPILFTHCSATGLLAVSKGHQVGSCHRALAPSGLCLIGRLFLTTVLKSAFCPNLPYSLSLLFLCSISTFTNYVFHLFIL